MPDTAITYQYGDAPNVIVFTMDHNIIGDYFYFVLEVNGEIIKKSFSKKELSSIKLATQWCIDMTINQVDDVKLFYSTVGKLLARFYVSGYKDPFEITNLVKQSEEADFKKSSNNIIGTPDGWKKVKIVFGKP